MKTLLDKKGRAVRNGALVLSRAWTSALKEHWEPCLCFCIPAPIVEAYGSVLVCWLDPDGRAGKPLQYADAASPRDYLQLVDNKE